MKDLDRIRNLPITPSASIDAQTRLVVQNSGNPQAGQVAAFELIGRWLESVGVDLTGFVDTDSLPEGTANLYFTNARASAAAPVQSVHGRTGTVAAAASDYDASQVDNDSGVTGATVAAALDALDTELGGVLPVALASEVSGTLPVTNGGTNRSTITPYTVLYGNGSSTVGIAGPGTTGEVLKGVTGAAPAFGAVALGTDVSGTLPHENGGLEADVSAYSGLVKISGGSTSQAVAGTDYVSPGGALGTPSSGVLTSCTGQYVTGGAHFAGITINTTKKVFPIAGGWQGFNNVFSTTCRSAITFTGVIDRWYFWIQQTPAGTLTIQVDNWTAGTNISFTTTSAGVTADTSSLAVTAGDLVTWSVVDSGATGLANLNLTYRGTTS